MITIWNKNKTKALFFPTVYDCVVAFEQWRKKKEQENKKPRN